MSDLGLPVADLSRLVDRGPIGLLVSRGDDSISAVNETLCEWLGYARREVVDALSLQDLLAPGDRIYFDTHVRPILTLQGEAREMAVTFVRADRTRLPVLVSAMRRVDEVSGEVRIETVVFDARERRRYELELLAERQTAQRSETRLKLMFDIVSGLSTTTTVEEVVAVIVQESARSMADTTCSVWLLGHEDRSVTRVGPGGSGPDQYDLPEGPAWADLRAGRLLSIDAGDIDNDAPQYPFVTGWLREQGRRSGIIAPLIDGERLVGVLACAFDGTAVLTEHEFGVVSSLAAQTQQALQRAWLLEAERLARARLQVLYAFMSELSELVSLDEVLTVLTTAGVELLGAISSRVGMLDTARGTIVVSGGHGIGSEAEVTLDLDAAALGCAAIEARRILHSPTRSELEKRLPESPILNEPQFGRTMAAPINHGATIVGFWALAFEEEGEPDADDLALAQLFVEQAGLATGRARLHEAESRAREQADVRQTISGALNRAMTADDVATVVAMEGRRAFGAAAIAVFAVGLAEDLTPVLLAERGLDDLTIVEEITGAAPSLHAGLSGGGPVVLEDLSASDGPLGSVDLSRWESGVVLPLHVGDDPLGFIIVFFDAAHGRPSVDTRLALGGMAAEATAALSRARRFETERQIAITLQRSTLQNQIPEAPGWTIDAFYTPGGEHLVAGGDLFDVTVMPDGRAVVVVGDVVGHGINAAAAMGQLRSASKMLALLDPTPSTVLDGLDRFARLTPPTAYASACCVAVTPDGIGLHASAGHLYPVVVHADGTTTLLRGGRGALLAVPRVGAQAEENFELEPGASLILYTDGLVERRHRDIDVGIEELRASAGSLDLAASAAPARRIYESMVADGRPADDIVVVCITRTGTVHP